jgi:hypothetical protein
MKTVIYPLVSTKLLWLKLLTILEKGHPNAKLWLIG